MKEDFLKKLESIERDLGSLMLQLAELRFRGNLHPVKDLDGARHSVRAAQVIIEGVPFDQ